MEVCKFETLKVYNVLTLGARNFKCESPLDKPDRGRGLGPVTRFIVGMLKLLEMK